MTPSLHTHQVLNHLYRRNIPKRSSKHLTSYTPTLYSDLQMASLCKLQPPPQTAHQNNQMFSSSPVRNPQTSSPTVITAERLKERPGAATTVWPCDDRSWRAAKSLAPKSHPIPQLKQYTPKGQLN